MHFVSPSCFFYAVQYRLFIPVTSYSKVYTTSAPSRLYFGRSGQMSFLLMLALSQLTKIVKTTREDWGPIPLCVRPWCQTSSGHFMLALILTVSQLSSALQCTGHCSESTADVGKNKKIPLWVNEKSCWPCPWHVMKTCTGAGCCSDIFIISFIVCSLHPKRLLSECQKAQWKTAHNVAFSVMNWATSQPVLPVSILNRQSHKGHRLLSPACSQSVMLWSLKLCMKGTDLTRVLTTNKITWDEYFHLTWFC